MRMALGAKPLSLEATPPHSRACFCHGPPGNLAQGRAHPLPETARISDHLGMWIPDPLYKTLPVIYVVTGALLPSAFGLNAASLLSSVLLIAAGLLTGLWRHRYRAAAAAASWRSPKQIWADNRQRRLDEWRRMDQQ